VKLQLPSRQVLIAVLLLAAAASSGLLIFGQRGLLDLHRLRGERAALERDNEALRRQNRDLSRQCDALREDPVAVEQAARQRLGMVKEGEVVYYLSGEGAAGGSPPAQAAKAQPPQAAPAPPRAP
jgi:cell division protein FtsB